MISPVIQYGRNWRRSSRLSDLELPDEETLFHLQMELAKSVKVEPNLSPLEQPRGLTEFEPRQLLLCDFLTGELANLARVRASLEDSEFLLSWFETAVRLLP